MNIQLDCINCFVRQSLEIIRVSVAGEERQQAAVRDVLGWLAREDLALSPPHAAQHLYHVLRRWTGNPDLYAEEKRRFNAIALAMLPRLRRRVEGSADPFATAARIAIAGNIIDLGIVPNLDEDGLESTIEAALAAPLAANDLEALRREAARAERILYLGDNAGEIVFDRLFLEQLPRERVVFVVRGGPVLNDATLEDAREAGLTELVRVEANGADVPGTVPELCTPRFRELYERADVVISKGQGNYECLCEEARPNLFFLLKVKCAVVAGQLGLPMGSVVLRRHRPERVAEAVAR